VRYEKQGKPRDGICTSFETWWVLLISTPGVELVDYFKITLVEHTIKKTGDIIYGVNVTARYAR